MKTVIVEIRGRYAAALSNDGCVMKIRNHNYAIGQVIEMKKQAAKTNRLIAWAASAAAVLMLCGVSGYAYYSPYSYVSLDVNPSIEFTLNRFDRVLSVKGVNDDGNTILMDVNLADLSNKSIGNAIALTVKEISEAGYFTGDEKGGIVIATSANDPEKASELAEELGQTVTDELESQGESTTIDVTSEAAGQTAENGTAVAQTQDGTEADQTAEEAEDGVVVEIVSVGQDRVARARELGVTPGRLHLVEKLQQSAAQPDDINVEEWLQKSVKEIMKATNENKKALKAQKPEDSDDADEAENETDDNAQDEDNQDINQQPAQTQDGTAIVQDSADDKDDDGKSEIEDRDDDDKSQNKGDENKDKGSEKQDNGKGSSSKSGGKK